MQEYPVMTSQTETPGNIWTCRKCGLLRSSRHTHKHNEPLPLEVLELFNGKSKRTGEE